MSENDVKIRDYFDLKFDLVDSKLTNVSGMVKDYYEDSCKRLTVLEDQGRKLNKETSFARWVQKNWKTAFLLLFVFTIVVASLNFSIILEILKVL